MGERQAGTSEAARAAFHPSISGPGWLGLQHAAAAAASGVVWGGRTRRPGSRLQQADGERRRELIELPSHVILSMLQPRSSLFAAAAFGTYLREPHTPSAPPHPPTHPAKKRDLHRRASTLAHHVWTMEGAARLCSSGSLGKKP